ncbi:MAG TPA: bifunctional 4-hydroxy-2-oxoglutarate aldolase/2-dehydro-3-deoxy-phosphogluconate aldolase [Candidatus Eisenbacteria bacterium]|nr:bifunctional 4-hydroxy-2-oxoglutarate aldolase/2-dehydro-3-deoxy-phosphogluconate aldolase [Candidatus Eisenbacteria bacterium]
MTSHVPAVSQALARHRLIAVIRAASAEQAVASARAVAAGGVPILELTFTIPDVTRAIRELARDLELVVGAGTVLAPEQAHAALDAGARFIVAPNANPAVAEVALARGAFYCPGAYTPSEIIAARAAGAHLVKVHPVGVAGGPAYIRVVRDPLPDIPMLAAGGTTLDNVPGFLDAGCVACGMGPALADPALAAAGRFAEIEQRARAFVRLIAEWSQRSGHAGAAVSA